MNTYEVVIRATVTKAITVNAADKDKAEEEAHEQFDIMYQANHHENYQQEMLSVEELEYDKEYES